MIVICDAFIRYIGHILNNPVCISYRVIVDGLAR